MRPLFDFQYSWDKVEAEQLLSDFAGVNKEVKAAILRACPVVGPRAASSIAALMFKPLVMIGICGYDPPLQFVHEDDVIGLLIMALNQGLAGVYNVAGDGEILYSEVARLARKRMLKLPDRLLRPLMAFAWAMHMQSDSPPSGLEFIKYPPVINTEKLRRETGFKFHYSSREAIASFLSSR